MKSTMLISILFALYAVGCAPTTEENTAEDVTADTTYIDVVAAAADHYKLLSADSVVRVIEMQLPPGVRDNKHSHKHETVYFINGGNVKIYVGNDTVEAQIPDGHVMHHEPWTHSVENVGQDTVHAIIFERMQMTRTEPVEGYLDPVQTAPAHYKELSRQGNVRLVHMTLGPGQQDARHSHYYETVYFLSGGKVKIHLADQVVDADIPDGHVMHHAPWTHSVQNVGTTTVEALIFERMPAAQ